MRQLSAPYSELRRNRKTWEDSYLLSGKPAHRNRGEAPIMAGPKVEKGNRETMNRIDGKEPATSTRTFAAIIQIQAAPDLPPAPNTGKRRITVLLDHPAAKGLALFSWLLVIVGFMVKQRAMAMVVSVFVIAGLLIGLVDGIRWLFSRGSNGH
jgi:hypothetical protein